MAAELPSPCEKDQKESRSLYGKATKQDYVKLKFF